METEKIKIISEPSPEKPFAVIYKPSGMPSAPLKADDENNAFSYTANLYPSLLEVCSSPERKTIEHGLLHRIDNVTSGLLLIAATQDFYNSMLIEQQNGRFYKTYKAECEDFLQNAEQLEGFPPITKDIYSIHNSLVCGDEVAVTSFFRNYGKGGTQVRPVTKDSNAAALKKLGKAVEYTTQIKMTEKYGDLISVECRINSGYRHQVRCHLAWLGFPIVGDSLYNANYQNVDGTDKLKIKFSATKLEFTYKDKDFEFCI